MILVTGAAGYIGSHVMSILGDEAVGIDSFIKGNPREGIVRCDIADPALKHVIRDNLVTAVINLAAVVGDPACAKYPQQALASNYEGVKALLQICAEAGTVQKFVQASTCSVYGFSPEDDLLTEDSPTKPLSLYAELKLQAEEAIRKSPMQHVIFRFSTAFGWSPSPRFDLTVNEFARDAALGREIEVYRKDDWRPYAHCSDLAGCCVLAAHHPGMQGTFNAGVVRNNHTKQMIINTISKYIPVPVNYVDGHGRDRRNYKVGFGKLAEVLPHAMFAPIDDGIVEIIEKVKRGGFNADDRTYRADHLYC